MMMTENLWAKAITDYWSDPQNVIGPPGALVRRVVKLTWLVLAVYVLFWIAGPSQVASWRLWMEDDDLAGHIAWGFTFASALCFAVVGYRAAESVPIKMPIFLPTFESWRGWRTTHLHLPNLTVGLGALLAASLFFIALLGQWNYYLHDGMTTGGASVAALSGSTDRVGEATRALEAHDASTVAALAIIDTGIRETSAGSPTGRSRLVRQRTELMQGAAATRAELAAELREARAATITAHTEFTDPRPVDGQVAGATGMSRGLVASLLDLLRSGVVEALLVMGAGLGLAVGTSRAGVPAGEVSFAGAEPVETVAETAPAPEAPPEPAPRRRFVLPVATQPDYAEAVAVGPLAGPVCPSDEPQATHTAETEETPVESPGADGDPTTIIPPEDEAPVDPLLAAALEMEPA